MQIGFCGDEAPRLKFPTVVGRTAEGKIPPLKPFPAVNVGVPWKDLAPGTFVGSDAQARRAELAEYKCPLDRSSGTIIDFDAYEALWWSAFKQMRVVPSERPFMISEQAMIQTAHREKLIQIAFESLEVPAYYASSVPVLSMYASGRTSGVLIDCGHTHTTVTPIYEGFGLAYAIYRMATGGQQITEYLCELTDYRTKRGRKSSSPPGAVGALPSANDLEDETVTTAMKHAVATALPASCDLKRDDHHALYHPPNSKPPPKPATNTSAAGGAAPTPSPPIQSINTEVKTAAPPTAASSGSPAAASNTDTAYTLPDGSSFVVFGAARQRCTDALWTPHAVRSAIFDSTALSTAITVKELIPLISDYYYECELFPRINYDYDWKLPSDWKPDNHRYKRPPHVTTLPQMVLDTVMRCDAEVRNDMWKNMVCSGGGAKLPGLSERLITELIPLIATEHAKPLVPSNTGGAMKPPGPEPQLKLITPPECDIHSWLGGSILGSLSHCGGGFWVSKDYYDENGPNCVHRKCVS